MDGALLILRATVGVLVAGHGAQKLFGWFGGSGLGQFSGWLASLGFRPPRLWAWMGALGEFGGGVLLTLGFLSPLGSLGIAASMLTAIAVAHWPKVWASEHGFELPLTNLVVALVVGMTGPGGYSLDAVLGSALPTAVAVLGVIVVLVGWFVGLTMWASRRPQPHNA